MIPDTPTLSETYPGFEVVTWYGIAAPPKTPREIMHKLNAGIVRGVASPDLAERYAAMGLEPRSSTPQEMQEYTRSEIAKWAPVVRAGGAKAE